MENDNQETPLEVMPPSAIMAMEKAQIDMQIATAHQYPRSLEIFKKRALQMATLDPETAESCVYCRNVGKEFNKETGRWEEKYAEGPSIRLAEIVAVSFGNLRAASRVVEQTERYVKCQGMAHDLESNTAMSADVIESTVTKEGKPYSERQRALTAKVCTAKALRDAILKVVPRALCKPVLEAAKKVATVADQPMDVRRRKAQAWVSSLKIDENRVLSALNVKSWADIAPEHLTILTGIKTAMADGDETIDSAFPPLGGAPQKGHVPVQEGPPPVPPGGKPTGTKIEPEKAPAASQDAPKPPEGKKPASTPSDAAATPPAKETPPQNAPAEPPTPPAPAEPANTTPAEDEKALQEAGLAPETQGQKPPEEAPPAGDPGLSRQDGDTDAIASIKLQCSKAAISWPQLKAWLFAKRLLKEGQRDMRDMATSKVESLNRVFGQKIVEIRSYKDQ